MNILLISTHYIEDCIKYSLEHFSHRDISKLYLLIENHSDDICNLTDTCNYQIEMVDTINSIQDEFTIFIYYDDHMNESLIEDAIKHARKSKTQIEFFITKIQYESLRKKVNDLSIFNCVFINDTNLLEPTYNIADKRKPIIVVCGVSKYNQQMKIEAPMCKILNDMSVTFDMVSYFMPYANYRIEAHEAVNSKELFEIWEKKLARIHEMQKNDKDITIISLPFELLSGRIFEDGVFAFLINQLNPDYSICCIPNEDRLLNNIDDVVTLFNNKYSVSLNSVFISDYESNKYEYSESYPIKRNKKMIVKEGDYRLFDAECMNMLFDDLISHITYPIGIGVIP